jgi:hypothetical protein
MTRPHVLLHRPNEKLRMARLEAWEGKDPGGVRVLLANPRWEGEAVCKVPRAVGSGGVMADGTDENGARAARMDEWVAWDATERAVRGTRGDLSFPFVRGARTPETCAQCAAEDVGSLLSEYTDRGPDTGSLCSCFSYFPYATYPLGMHGVSRETNK